MDNLLLVLKQHGMWGGVLGTLTFIVLGFFATKKGILTKETNGRITKFLIQFALPFLCIAAFMQPANKALAKEIGIVLATSILFYVLAAVVSAILVKHAPKLVPKLVTKKAEELLAASGNTGLKGQYREEAIKSIQGKVMTTVIMLSYGSLQFFAYPLLIALSGDVTKGAIFDKGSALALAQIWCLPYMIAAFSYVAMQYSGQKISKATIKPIMKAILHPMMIALYISLFMWALQFAVTTKFGLNFQEDPKGQQFWQGLHFKAGKIFPTVSKILGFGIGIISPLAWIVIGGSLAASDIKKSMANKSVWIVSVLRLTLMPLIAFLIAVLLVSTKLVSVSTGTMLTLLGATPPAAVCIMFAVANKHEHTTFTAEVSALSTLLSVFAMPVWIVIANVALKAIAGV
ncbi:AEC family transporter [Mycoplasma phocoenae]|uniref:Malate transporter n=1 Tax=Mycoplasma phocoenae TaxID=754517 RepID=A0A858U353_9MOLU|nr:AEC family transporter [Mycoplasma phocoenae]QJG66852.1 malate transporter [Mycoplasma phocoenae]